MNTLRGSYTCRFLDNSFWNVHIPLNHLRKQHKLVKEGHLSRPTLPRKTCSVPMSAPGGVESTGNQKCPSLLFHSRGKKNRRADQSVGIRRGTLPVQWPQWTQSLTAMGPREKTSHCPLTKLTVQRRRRKHPSTAATVSSAPPTQAWFSSAVTCQTKQQSRSCQTWNSTSFQAIIAKERYTHLSLLLEEKLLQVRCMHLHNFLAFNVNILTTSILKQCVQYEALNFDFI